MSDKQDLDVDVSQLANVEPEVLAALRVGHRLKLAVQGTDEAVSLCTEAGVQVAPLTGNRLAARFPNPKVIVRAIKREVGSGTIQKLQIRIYRSDDAGPATSGAVAAGAQCLGVALAGAPAADAQADGVTEETDYKLRRTQYQSLADSEELRAMLADPRLQEVLAKIDGAPDRERALAAQLETPGFQGFVSQVLMNLDPDRVPATAATAAAIAMATR